MSGVGEPSGEENAEEAAADAVQEATAEVLAPEPAVRAHGATWSTAARWFTTANPWVLPLVTALVALPTGGVLGYLLHPAPTASEEYLSAVDDRDRHQERLEAALGREEDLQEELQPLQEQAAEFDDRESELDDRAESLDEREAELDQREEDISATEREIAENTFPGNGTYLVGEDIKPGTYRSSGSGDCYWARLSSTDGELGSIITNSFGSGAQVVTIRSGDVAFETSGCGEWTRSD